MMQKLIGYNDADQKYHLIKVDESGHLLTTSGEGSNHTTDLNKETTQHDIKLVLTSSLAEQSQTNIAQADIKDTLALSSAYQLQIRDTLINDIKAEQTEIKNLLNTMQPDLHSLVLYRSYYILKNLRRLRSYGHCYSSNSQGVTNSASGVYNVAFLENPSTNTNLMYVYKINYSINFDSANGAVLPRIFSCPFSSIQQMGVAGAPIANMRVDSAVSSGVSLRISEGASLNISPVPKMLEVQRVVDRGEGTFYQSDFQEEYIHIPPGWCVGLSINSLVSVPVHWSFNTRFAMTGELLDV